jgi:hypothetical protein
MNDMVICPKRDKCGRDQCRHRTPHEHLGTACDLPHHVCKKCVSVNASEDDLLLGATNG